VTIGDEFPEEMAIFQRTFVVGLKTIGGRADPEIARPPGPRNWGQSSANEFAE
jgi:hypothetical protein